MKNPLKNALKLLKPKEKPEQEKFALLSTEDKLGKVLGVYFYERQKNNGRQCDQILRAIERSLEQEENNLSEAWEMAYQVISDFREFEAKAKGWK